MPEPVASAASAPSRSASIASTCFVFGVASRPYYMAGATAPAISAASSGVGTWNVLV